MAWDTSYERFLASLQARSLGLVKDLKRDYGAYGSPDTYTGSIAAGSRQVTGLPAGHQLKVG